MRRELVEELKKEVSTRQAIKTELEIARRIQESMLPKTFISGEEFSLHASLSSAKEVSGDFYDFFFLNDDTIVLVIGDVSGKKIPASIFMAVTRTALRNVCQNFPDNPSRALNDISKYLVENNSTYMFVTVILAYFNIKSGIFTYANAGHDDIILLKPDGSRSLPGSFNNIALGVATGCEYKQEKIKLEKDDKIIFYTDGVTEALSPEGQFFGFKKFCNILGENVSLAPEELCTKVVNTLLDFQGKNQHDDITLMILQKK